MRGRVLMLAMFAAGCGSGTAGGRSSTTVVGPRMAVPSTVDDASFDRLAAQLADLADAAPERPMIRDRLVQFLAGKCRDAVEHQQADEASEAFANALKLYRPIDLPDSLDAHLLPCAEGVRRALAPGGDEARVMAALIVIGTLRPTDAAVQEERARIEQWAAEVRQSLPTESERTGSLVRVYEGLVELLPLRRYVDKLRELYLERHRALRRMFATGQMPPPGSITREQYQSFILALDRTAYDIVRLHLQLGTPQRAAGHLQELRAGGETDRRVLAALSALADDPEEGFIGLAQIYGREHPEAALRSCRLGREAMPDSPRFALCIARLQVRSGDLAAALVAYDEAIERNPGEQEVYTEALEITTETLRALLEEEDLVGARQAHRKARRLQRAFRRAFPDRRLPVDTAQIEYLMGIGEYQSGEIDRAVEHLGRSVEINATKDALVQLGLISERRGQLDEALRFYRRALDLPARGPEARLEQYWRATILEHLGDVHALKGEAPRARTMWQEGLEAWRLTLTAQGSELRGEELASGQLRRGLLLEKLGRSEDAVEAFRAALEARPDLRNTYEQLLTHYAADGRLREALQTYRRAINHASIPEEWKVYYAMWVVATQRRAGDSSETAPLAFLRDVRGEDWTDRLAQFYAGTLPYERLLQAAGTPGERAEAYFYEALNRLAAGRVDQATELLRQVLATEMMGFFEYDMARRILVQLAARPAAVTPPTP